MGPNFLGQKKQHQKNATAQVFDIITVEIQANLSRTETRDRFEEMGNQDTGEFKNSNGDQESRNVMEEDAVVIIAENTEMENQVNQTAELEIQVENHEIFPEEAVPIKILLPTENGTNPLSIPTWIKKHIN